MHTVVVGWKRSGGNEVLRTQEYHGLLLKVLRPCQQHSVCNKHYPARPERSSPKFSAWFFLLLFSSPSSHLRPPSLYRVFPRSHPPRRNLLFVGLPLRCINTAVCGKCSKVESAVLVCPEGIRRAALWRILPAATKNLLHMSLLVISCDALCTQAMSKITEAGNCLVGCARTLTPAVLAMVCA